MINKTDIITILEKLNNKYFTYYQYSKERVNSLSKDIHKIQKRPYIFVGVRELLLSNPDNYILFLSSNRYKGASYVKYSLDKIELINFLELIELNEKYNSNILNIIKINSTEDYLSKLNIKLENEKYILYFNIINKKDKNISVDILNSMPIIQIKNYYDSISFLLNNENLNILKYQRLDRIKTFIKSNPEAKDVYNILQEYNEHIHTLGYKERDQMIIHSGSIFEVLGTTYTRDVDVIKVDLESTKEQLQSYIKSQSKLIDISILDQNLNYITKSHDGENISQLRYKKTWFTKTLPQLVKAKDIFEVYINPIHHFYIAGIKFSSLEFNIQRFLQRASISSMADLIMLQEINGYNTHKRLCLPNMTIRQGKLVIFYGKYLEIYYKELQKSLKRYYDKEILMEQLQKLIKFCTEGGHDIYKGEITWDPDTSIIKYYHVMIKDTILNKYTKNCDYLLDIGSGKLTDMRLWDKNNVKNVIGIEPSKESIKIGEEKIKKIGFKGNLHIINGFGDENWSKNKIYNKVLENKYDIITIQFAFHYMTKHLDIIIKNIKSVVKKGSKLIITCMDGNKIHNDFIRFKGNIEVRNDQEPIFAIAPRYKVTENIPDANNDILVYFKGAFGVSSGSIEPIIDIDKIVKIFALNGLELIEKRNFTEYENDTKKKMSHIQLKVSSYYMMLVFENK
jgi:SAM-dependent methyltransferase